MLHTVMNVIQINSELLVNAVDHNGENSMLTTLYLKNLYNFPIISAEQPLGHTAT